MPCLNNPNNCHFTSTHTHTLFGLSDSMSFSNHLNFREKKLQDFKTRPFTPQTKSNSLDATLKRTKVTSNSLIFFVVGPPGLGTQDNYLDIDH